MSRHVRRRTQPRPEPAKPVRPSDTTQLDLAELAALWPRLDAALARDGAGPSAGSERSGSPAPESSAVIDLDTERVRTRVELGVLNVAAAAYAALGIVPPERRAAVAHRELALIAGARHDARSQIERVHEACDLGYGRGLGYLRRPTLDEANTLRTAVATLQQLRGQVGRPRSELDLATRDTTVEAVINQLPAWYSKLVDQKHPLARRIAKEVPRWTTDARSVLRLRTGGRQLDHRCPHHRDSPSWLVKVADEAQLSAAVIAGRKQPRNEAPLRWLKQSAVHCPKCRERWAGEAQLRMLMRMVDMADREDRGEETTMPELVEFLKACIRGDEQLAVQLLGTGVVSESVVRRWLAECDAKRAIIGDDPPAELAAAAHYWQTLEQLAAVYSDHPDHRDDWHAQPEQAR